MNNTAIGIHSYKQQPPQKITQRTFVHAENKSQIKSNKKSNEKKKKKKKHTSKYIADTVKYESTERI